MFPAAITPSPALHSRQATQANMTNMLIPNGNRHDDRRRSQKNKSIKFHPRCQNIKMYNIQFARRSSKILHLRWKRGVGDWAAYKLRHPLSSVTQHDVARDGHRNGRECRLSQMFASLSQCPTTSSCPKLSCCEMQEPEWRFIGIECPGEEVSEFDKRSAHLREVCNGWILLVK